MLFLFPFLSYCELLYQPIYPVVLLSYQTIYHVVWLFGSSGEHGYIVPTFLRKELNFMKLFV